MKIALAALLAPAIGAADARNFRLKMPLESDMKPSSKSKKGGIKSKKGAERAESADEFGTLSVSGTYASFAIIGANGGLGLGVNHYENDGSVSGDQVINLPQQDPTQDPSARSFIPFTYTGSLDFLDADGVGMQTALFDFSPAGFNFTRIQNFNLQVTGRQGSRATTFSGALDGPSIPIPGALGVFEYTSRAAGGFGASSMLGLYGLTCVSGQFVGFRSGGVTFDGEGGFSGRMTQNDPDPEDPENFRSIVEVDLAGTYAVQDNGFAEITFEGIGPSTFLVTTNEGQLATSLTGGFAVAAPENGGLIRCDLDILE